MNDAYNAAVPHERKLVMKNVFSKLAVIVLATCGATAFADTATGTFQVKMTILKACTVKSATDIQLGAAGGVVATSISNVGQNTITVNCSKTTPYKIGLAPSVGNSGTTSGTGNMISTTAPGTNTDKVPYSLYSDSTYANAWGNTDGVNTIPGTGSGLDQPITAYGRNVNANFTPDSYADTVTVNVTF